MIIPIDVNGIKLKNKSTGPLTEEGKQRASLNALKHGLFAKETVFIAGETQEAFDAAAYKLNEEFRPRGASEEELVRILLLTSLRQERLVNLESRAINKAVDDGDFEFKFLNNAGLYTQRLTRTFQSTLKQLREVQSKRMVLTSRNFRYSAILYAWCKKKGIPWKPEEHGFVFSIELMEKQIKLTKDLDAAIKAIDYCCTSRQMDELLAFDAS